MAYILGYFCADGSMFVNPRGSKYIAFYSVDKELVVKVKRILDSKNSGGYHLIYSKNDSGKLFNFMYNNVSVKEYLERKYNKFQKAFKAIGAVA